MDEMKKMVLEYVKKEYLEEDDDREVTETTPLISGGIVDSFSMVSLSRKEVCDKDTGRRCQSRSIRYCQ